MLKKRLDNKSIKIFITMFVMVISLCAFVIPVMAELPPVYQYSEQVIQNSAQGEALIYTLSSTSDAKTYMDFYSLSDSIMPESFTYGGYFAFGTNDYRFVVNNPVTVDSYSNWHAVVGTMRFVYSFSEYNNGEGYYEDRKYPIVTGADFSFDFYGTTKQIEVPEYKIPNYNIPVENRIYGDDTYVNQRFTVDLQSVYAIVTYRVTDQYSSINDADYIYRNDQIVLSASDFTSLSNTENIYTMDSYNNALHVPLKFDFVRPVELVSIQFDVRIKYTCDYNITSLWDSYSAKDIQALSNVGAIMSYSGNFAPLYGYGNPVAVNLFKGYGDYYEPSGLISDSVKDANEFLESIENTTSISEFESIINNNVSALKIFGGIVTKISSHEPIRSLVIASCVVIVAGSFAGLAFTIVKRKKGE